MEFFEEYKKEAKEFDPELTHSEITMMYMNDYHPRLHDEYIRSLRPPTKRVKWTPTEVSYLKKHYPDIPIWKIAEKLKRSYKSVTSKIQALELRKDFNRMWYVQFLKYLKKQHPGLDTWSKLSIIQQVIKHVVTLNQTHPPTEWTFVEEWLLRELYPFFPERYMRKVYNRDPYVLSAYVNHFKLPKSQFKDHIVLANYQDLARTLGCTLFEARRRLTQQVLDYWSKLSK